MHCRSSLVSNGSSPHRVLRSAWASITAARFSPRRDSPPKLPSELLNATRRPRCHASHRTGLGGTCDGKAAYSPAAVPADPGRGFVGAPGSLLLLTDGTEALAPTESHARHHGVEIVDLPGADRAVGSEKVQVKRVPPIADVKVGDVVPVARGLHGLDDPQPPGFGDEPAQFLSLLERQLERTKDAFVAVVRGAPAMIVLSVDCGRSPVEEFANDAALYIDELIGARATPGHLAGILANGGMLLAAVIEGDVEACRLVKEGKGAAEADVLRRLLGKFLLGGVPPGPDPREHPERAPIAPVAEGGIRHEPIRPVLESLLALDERDVLGLADGGRSFEAADLRGDIGEEPSGPAAQGGAKEVAPA